MTACDWCEKEYEPSFLLIDAGHVFCDEKCEEKYYDDRAERRKLGKNPLFLERRLSRQST